MAIVDLELGQGFFRYEVREGEIELVVKDK